MRAIPALLLSSALAACASASSKKSPGSTQCAGQLTFVVSNRSNRDVDVLANVNGGAPQAIATVRAGGNEEIMLPKGTTTAYTQFAREGSTVGPRGRVDTRYSCRP